MTKFGFRNLITILFIILMFSTLGAQTAKLTLEECINHGLANSTVIKRSNNTIESKQSTLEQSKAALAPDLTFSVKQNLSSSSDYDPNSGNWLNATNTSTSFNLSSSITLYNGAKLINSIRQKKTELSAAELETETENELLSLEILTAYINVLLAEEQFQNSEIQFQTTENQVEYAKAKKSAGVISKANFLNIRSQLATDKAALIAAKSQLRINYVSLMQTMNMPISESFHIVTPAVEELLKEKQQSNSEEIYNSVLQIRPEIKIADLNLESSRLDIKIAKADALPSLMLNGSLESGYNKDLAGVSFAEQFDNQIKPSIGLSLSIPLFQRKQVKNQVTQARISLKNSALDLIDIKNNLRKNIEQACTDVEVAEMKYLASIEQLQAEEEYYLLSEEMFSQGLINSGDYLSAKENLSAAESSRTQAKYNLLLRNKIIDYYLAQPIIF